MQLLSDALYELLKCNSCFIFGLTPYSPYFISSNICKMKAINLPYKVKTQNYKAEQMFEQLFDIVDTLLSYERGLIVCLFLQDFSEEEKQLATYLQCAS